MKQLLFPLKHHNLFDYGLLIYISIIVYHFDIYEDVMLHNTSYL